MALLELCLNAKILRLTATSIQYLDNNRGMAKGLYCGYIANEMTLGEAVVRGILLAPKYVTTVYQYQKTLAKYQAWVDNLRALGIQDVNKRIWAPCAGHRNRQTVWTGSLPIISRISTACTSCSASTRSTWVKLQRYTRHNPEKSCAVLTEERIAKLDEIGMSWETRNPKSQKSCLNLKENVEPAKAG